MSKICPECGTENEPQFDYCKNCGAKLENSKSTGNRDFNNSGNSSNNGGNPQPDYSGYAQNNNSENPGVIEGITREELSAFIGNNSEAIISKFYNMEIQDTKASWCWPVAFLSFLFGPIGAAIWFFYRKLYKPACTFLIVFLLVTTLSAALIFSVFPVGIPQIINDVYQAVTTAEEGEEQEAVYDVIKPVYDEVASHKSIFVTIDLIENITRILSIVLSGIFAYELYRRRAENIIKRFRSINPDPRYYYTGLRSLGGTSVGMVILCVAVMVFVPSIIAWTLALILLM